ncbi:MAG: endonuclease/exonuclease/phosphatase family protein [Tannerellaceae bacterium]|nr:endonuclease/exonuclease/phosphatase family protein [Tannerellaceae bacterium]
MKIYSWLVLLIGFSTLSAQTPFSHFSFDEWEKDWLAIEADVKASPYIHAGYRPVFSSGLNGLALDLTEDVEVRIPVWLTSQEIPSYERSFSFVVWIRTKPGARQGTPVMSNRKVNRTEDPGWVLGTDDRGAWYFQISDGEHAYTYHPTAEKQAIHDGQWHQIAVSVNLDKQEIWFYFDGRNTAIYNAAGLLHATGAQATVIGGSDEYTDWGSRGEWTAFNGWIDEVSFWDRPLSSQEVQALYHTYRAPAEINDIPVNPDRLKVQVWNIWHGGRRYGQHVGVARVVDVLKQNNADVIGLVETYGSGEIIADSLGYYFYLISSNLSIMSRYPIEETIKIHEPFFSGGAVLDLGKQGKIAFFDIWLHASPDICRLIEGEQIIAGLLEKEHPLRVAAIEQILSGIKDYVKEAEEMPVILAGDFNCGSHLDWTEESKDIHYGMVVDWPVSHRMLDAGFRDSFRELYPNPVMNPGFTWSPLINPQSPEKDCIHDRIDYIYYKGKKLLPYQSKTIDHHPTFWPSDHNSVITWFYLKDN